jgi:hypothetical protein
MTNRINQTNNSVSGQYAYTPQKAAKSAGQEKKINENSKTAVKKANDAENSGVYTKKTAQNEKTAKSGKSEGIFVQISMIRQQNAEQLIQMVYDILNMQGYQGFVASRKLEDAILGIKEHIENGGTITPEEKAAAAAAIAEDGQWGVEAVSDRLVSMAVKLADGDEGKFKMMKSAIESGFKAAEAMWGGELPEICYKTFEATMKKLAEAFGQVQAESA